MESKSVTRRQLLLSSVGTLSGAALLWSNRTLGAVCNLTPAQGEGPFYPEEGIHNDNDLTQIQPGAAKASGQIIYIKGVVIDHNCEPIRGARVEIWQASSKGKYNHSEDHNPTEPDPHFQYWGLDKTDDKGNYRFKTIIPGHYPVGGGRYRPPHVHFKVFAAGFISLTTQMYFNPLSYDDPQTAAMVDKLNKLEDVDRRLTVHFKEAGTGFEPMSKLGQFDIALREILIAR